MPEAWQDIFNSRPPLPKPSLGIWRPINDVNSFATTNNADDHNRIRKILNPAFSDRALKAQEYILQDYTDLLITRLREQISSAGGGPITVDVDSWYGFTTFDTVGDLCFGDSFQSLQNSEHHPWVQAIFKGFKFGMLLTAFDHFGARELVRWFLPRSLNAQAKLHAEFTSRKIDQRIQNKSARPDFMSYILNHREKEGMSRDELDSTGVFLVFAGSETSASVSTSTTWFTLKNPLVMRRLQQEVRGNFVSAEDIKLSEMSKLPYLHAVILEAMRLQPVSPVSIPREVDRPGTIVCGHEIPVGVSGIHHFFFLFCSFLDKEPRRKLRRECLDTCWYSTKARVPTSTEFRRSAFFPSRALAQRCRPQIRSRSKNHVRTVSSRASQLHGTKVCIIYFLSKYFVYTVIIH